MFMSVNGIRLMVAQRGQGREPVLLLIHGFPLDHRMWTAQLRGLAADCRVLAPDLRGHGTSELTPGPLTMDQHADDLAALLDRLGIGRAIVAGLSMGGYVAFAFWRRHRERVQALALLDTRAEPDGPAARANRDVMAARVQQAGAGSLADEMLPKRLAPASRANPRVSSAVHRMSVSQPVGGIGGALAGLRDREDSRLTLPTITVPVLALTGEADVLTPPADVAAMAAAIPAARLVMIPGAGHLSPMENPRAVNAALRAFAREVFGTGGAD